jgi:molecular chaperone GrpE
MTKKENGNNCKNCDDCDCKQDINSKESAENESKKVSEQTSAEQANAQIQIEELKKQYEDIKDTLQRVYAEFQNYKKRMDEDKQKFVNFSNEELIKKILPIADNFEIALNHKINDDEFSKGMELIYSQFTQILEDEGVKRILSSGKFNPKLHEVLITEESQKEEGVILEEIQKGYMLGGKVLRHAKVKISKNTKRQSEALSDKSEKKEEKQN